MRGENRRFMEVVLGAFIVVVVCILASATVFSLRSVNRSLDSSRELLLNGVKERMEEQLEETERMLKDPFLADYFRRGSGGDERNTWIMLFNMLLINLEDPYYLALEKGGVVVDSKLIEEAGKPLPPDAREEGAFFLKEFRSKSGTLVYASRELSNGIKVVAVKDVSGEVKGLEASFESQRSELRRNALILLAVFLCLSLLLVVLVVMPANNRFISGPVRTLNEKALRMMEGETGLDIEVNEKSDYYALQALLDSMRRLLEREAKRDESEEEKEG